MGYKGIGADSGSFSFMTIEFVLRDLPSRTGNSYFDGKYLGGKEIESQLKTLSVALYF
jgi:hypothetical protein